MATLSVKYRTTSRETSSAIKQACIIELAIGLEGVALSLNTDGASLLLSNDCDRDGCEMSVVPSTVSETTLFAARYAVTWRIIDQISVSIFTPVRSPAGDSLALRLVVTASMA